MFGGRLYRGGMLWLAAIALSGVAMAPPAVAIARSARETASSSALVYSCGKGFASICQGGATGIGAKQLLKGSATPFAKRYGSPSLSRNGKVLAFTLGYKLYVLNRTTGRRTGPISNGAWLARMSPNGTKVGDLEQYPYGGGWVMTACMFNSNGSGVKAGRDCIGATGSFGFTNDNHVLASVSDQWDAQYNRYDEAICLLASDGTGCNPFVASDLGHDLSDPALSPNGKLLAVTRAVPGQTEGEVALYNYATGALVRTLTSGKTDSGPVWSPDGSRIAFVRGASTSAAHIYTVAVGGGTVKSIAAGRGVTWGK